jgi:hypothetical protein
MKRTYFIISILLFFSACSGVDSQIKKNFKNTENTIAIKDLTKGDYKIVDAGSQLESALEDMMARSIFVITHEEPKYVLKYKILDYSKGSRIARFSTFGFSKSAHGKLQVKVALYDEGQKVGAWTIDSWLKGGLFGGNPRNLFIKISDEISKHLRGDDIPF